MKSYFICFATERTCIGVSYTLTYNSVLRQYTSGLRLMECPYARLPRFDTTTAHEKDNNYAKSQLTIRIHVELSRLSSFVLAVLYNLPSLEVAMSKQNVSAYVGNGQ